jgi:site-specific recombinase XerD
MALTLPNIETSGDLGDELGSFIRSLRAENVSENTQYAYAGAVVSLGRFLLDRDLPTDVRDIKRQHLEAWQDDLLHGPKAYKDTTAHQRYRGAQRFFNWYKGVLDDDDPYRSPMEKMHPPRLARRLTDVLSVDQIDDILREAAAGPYFERKRDVALIHTFRSSGARRAEIANLTAADIDFDRRVIRVIGKGDKERLVPIDAVTVKALEDYRRARKAHPHASLPWLWLGRKGRLTDSGIAQTVRDLGMRAGIPGVHPHLFRHSRNAELDRLGVSVEHRMSAFGWASDKMPRHYGATTLNDRAIDAIREATERKR